MSAPIRCLLGAITMCMVALPRSADANAPAGHYVVTTGNGTGNGTVYDTKSKLTWQQTAPATTYTWDDAKSYCAGVGASLAGTGWRVPTVEELRTIVDPTQGNPSIDSTIFPSTPADRFWSSSPVARSPSNAWAVFFDSGQAYSFDVSLKSCVRCVRGAILLAQPSPAFNAEANSPAPPSAGPAASVPPAPSAVPGVLPAPARSRRQIGPRSEAPIMPTVAAGPEFRLHRHRLQLSAIGGWALKTHQVATVQYTSSVGGVTIGSGTQDIRASLGGGWGVLFTYGFALFDFLEITGSVGGQWPGLDTGDVSGVSGGFSNLIFLAGPQFNIPLHHFVGGFGDSVVRLTLSGGPSWHLIPSLEADLSAAPNGSDTVFKYSSATSWYGTVGIEVGMPRSAERLGVMFGLSVGYYPVTYRLQSVTQDKAAMPISTVNPEFQKTLGDAINVTLYFAVLL